MRCRLHVTNRPADLTVWAGQWKGRCLMAPSLPLSIPSIPSALILQHVRRLPPARLCRRISPPSKSTEAQRWALSACFGIPQSVSGQPSGPGCREPGVAPTSDRSPTVRQTQQRWDLNLRAVGYDRRPSPPAGLKRKQFAASYAASSEKARKTGLFTSTLSDLNCRI